MNNVCQDNNITSAAREAGQKKKKRGTAIPITKIPLRANRFKRGTLGDDFNLLPERWAVETNFHSTGQIKNGPEATVAEIITDRSATCCSSEFHWIPQAGHAKELAQLFAGSPRLLLAARAVTDATGKEPKFKHSETYRALTELMRAVEAIESGSLVFNP